MIRVRKGQHVGPWILESKLLEHQNDCEIWEVRHFKMGTSAVLKLRSYSDMGNEMKLIIDMHHDGYRLPVFDIQTIYRGDFFGTFRDYGWVAMKKYDGDLGDLDRGLVCEHWKSIMRQCVVQIHTIHLLGYIHSDLKMMNILVSVKDGKCDAAICDFGLIEPADKLIRDGRPIEDLPYYYMCAGKHPDEPMGARTDYEALGISVGLRLTETGYHTAFKKGNEAECREWQNLKQYIPEYVHGYFKILEDVLWTDRRLQYEKYTQLLKFLE